MTGSNEDASDEEHFSTCRWRTESNFFIENNGVFKKGMKFIEYTSITICSYVLNWSQAIWMSRKIGPI